MDARRVLRGHSISGGANLCLGLSAWHGWLPGIHQPGSRRWRSGKGLRLSGILGFTRPLERTSVLHPPTCFDLVKPIAFFIKISLRKTVETSCVEARKLVLGFPLNPGRSRAQLPRPSATCCLGLCTAIGTYSALLLPSSSLVLGSLHYTPRRGAFLLWVAYWV